MCSLAPVTLAPMRGLAVALVLGEGLVVALDVMRGLAVTTKAAAAKASTNRFMMVNGTGVALGLKTSRAGSVSSSYFDRVLEYLCVELADI